MPIIRIQKIVLDNFKSVKHGEIETACGRKFVPMNTQSDILGVYGQNGSGKTSLIEALSIFKFLLMGEQIPDDYVDCIMCGEESASIELTLDFQYEDKPPCKVVYSVILGKREKKIADVSSFTDDYGDNSNGDEETLYSISVISECIKVAGDFEGGKKMQVIIDTSQGEVFGPVSKNKYFIKDKEAMLELAYNKKWASNFSQSFIFMKRTLCVLNKHSSEYIDLLNSMSRYGISYLFVVDTKSSGLIRLNVSLPIILRRSDDSSIKKTKIVLGMKGPSKLTEEAFKDVNEVLDNINIVLCRLIPGLTIRLKDLGPVMLPKSNIIGKYAELVSAREGRELPLRDESDGVKKIISTLQLYIDAYNDGSMTVAIDEFDAGIFEYLLGEMLEIFEDTGKGQFIFTSHNLRPLEVINKTFICFTTTDEEDRYTRLDNVKVNNNLRNVYFRAISSDDEEDELYLKEKKYKIVQALRKAGQVLNG